MGVRVDSRAFRDALTRAEPALSSGLRDVFDMTGDTIVNVAKRETNAAIKARGTGRLVQSLRHDPATGSLGAGFVVDLMAGGLNGVDYAAPFYLGARPHVIEARARPNGKPGFLRFAQHGVFIFARRVRHPGNAPHAILREAIESSLGTLELRVYLRIRTVLRRFGVEVA